MVETRSYKWVYVLVAAGYLWLLWNFFGASSSDSTVCMFKHATGFACPSCGSTRSLLAIISGDFGSAFRINPLGFLGALGLLFVPLVGLFDKLTNNNFLSNTLAKMEAAIRQPRIAFPLVALVLTNWAWNIFKQL